jgi:hypothetical protein
MGTLDNNGHFWLVLMYRRNTVGGQIIGPATVLVGMETRPPLLKKISSRGIL